MSYESGCASELNEEELGRVRAALWAHAREIALTAAGAGDHWLVVALLGRDGTWGGTWTATEYEQIVPYLQPGQVSFVVPARCRTAEDVRQLVREHLGDAGAP